MKTCLYCSRVTKNLDLEVCRGCGSALFKFAQAIRLPQPMLGAYTCSYFTSPYQMSTQTRAFGQQQLSTSPLFYREFDDE